MDYVSISGLDFQISKIVLGTISLINKEEAFKIYDAFLEAGGNCVDTAHIYNDGLSERVLGRWMKTRGNRDSIAVIVKGAHPPKCTPDSLHIELSESLERLGIITADVYFLHRDDLSIPVSEWVDALNHEVDVGRIRTFGGSNWTYQRIDEGNTWARKNRKREFAAVSNQFSLAEMIEAPWEGCLSSGSKEYIDWHVRHHFPNFAWSSQAQGFFAGTDMEPAVNKDFIHCWDSKSNRNRRNKVFEIARTKKIRPTTLALAYVVNQKFSSIALIGPSSIEHLNDSIEAVNIILNDDELHYLAAG